MADEKNRDHSVIASDRVEDTDVYGKDGDKMGTVRRIMIGKLSGQVRDVEISVGSFLGIGGELHSIPWDKLSYDTDLDGYRLDVTEQQLREAPTYKESDRDRLRDRDYQTRVYEYWAVSPYW